MENTTRTERVCVTCPGLGRDGVDGRPDPNFYDYRHACEECRPALHGLLKRIPGSYADLDATPTGGQREHVSGTIEAPLGVRVAVLDQIILTPATTLPLLPGGPDQEGVLPAPRILWHIANAWLPAWRDSHPLEHLPAPEVWRLADWLDNRLDWACNTLPALMAAHAGYLSALAHRLDRLVNPGTDKPESINVKIPCPECDRCTLARFRGEVICTCCGARKSIEEYDRWVGLNAALNKHTRAA